LVPDLVIEVLSKSNTPAEMQRKLGEYFAAGVRLAWFVDVDTRTVTACTSAERSEYFTDEQTLDAPDVLPGFTLRLANLFAELDRQGT
jgi:Uma2 family endonuclease